MADMMTIGGLGDLQDVGGNMSGDNLPPGQIGQRLEQGNVALTVLSAERMQQVGDLPDNPDMVYMVADVTIENNQTEAIDPSSGFSVVDATGTSYEATLLATEEGTPIGELQPEAQVTGLAVFEVPESTSSLILNFQPLEFFAEGTPAIQVALEESPDVADTPDTLPADDVTGLTGPNLPAVTQGAISAGGSVTAELNTLDEAHDWTFEGIAGQQVTIRAEAAQGTSTDPRIHLYDPAGNVIAADDDGGGDTNALISAVSLEQDGTYIIRVDVFTEGEYVLSLEATEPVAQAPDTDDTDTPAADEPAPDTPSTPDGPVPTPAPDAPVGAVINGGNLRDGPSVDTGAILGQVCPDDQVEFLEQQGNWYRVRVYATAEDCVPAHVDAGTEGWLSGLLVSTPSAAVPGGTEEPATAAPTAETPAQATPTQAPAAQATPTQAPADAQGSAQVINGGNLRSEPRIAPDTVIGQVCPGDTAEVLQQQQAAGILWYRIRIATTAVDCHPERVATGTEGWLSSILLTLQ
jgi:hypothetical protein